MSTSGDPLKRVLPGEPFAPSAAAWNAMIESARRIAQMESSSQRSLSPNVAPGLVRVRNSSGTALDAGDIVGFGDVLFTPTDNLDEFRFRPTVQATIPTRASHSAHFGVLAGAIPNNGIGYAQVSGLVACRVESLSTTVLPGCVEVRNNDATKLSLVSDGIARVVWRESGTGTKRAIILFSRVSTLRFFARITGSALISGASYRWAYSWEEVMLPEYGSGDTFALVPGGRSGTTTTRYAINAMEADNTSSFAGASYQIDAGETFLPRPIGLTRGSVQRNPVVEMRRLTNGRHVFDPPNTIDGECA
jgi:hypothetical protein